MSEQTERRRWLGGYVRQGKKGNVFVIERWIAGEHFHLSTKCRTERAALKELERFEMDPASYRPGEKAHAPSSCVVTPELIAEYEVFQATQKQTTQSHARDCARYLEAWMHLFSGRDLRRIDLHQVIKPALDRWQREAAKGTGARKSRIVALKGFTAWLRREKGLLKRAEDPTLDLQVPQAKPEKLRRKKVVTMAQVESVVSVLREDCRDTMLVLANTGLHISEVRRFAKEEGDLYEPTAEKRALGAKAMLSVTHKSGRIHTVALTTDEAKAAATRIKMGRWVPSHSVLWHAMRAACAEAGIDAFNAGVLRHSVATWLHESGVPLPAISEQLGHRDPRTTADFYRDLGGQARPLPLPTLRLVK